MKQYNILVVDDSTTNIVLLEAILEENGYKIDTALNVKEAIQCIDKRLPDLILLDLLMPKVSGFEFLEQLRADENTRMIPVLVVSAIADDDNINRILHLGAVNFIKKPIDIQYLVEEVHKILNSPTH
jgi:two-component system, cell cycle response regulator DivK